jgi:hypothetical protein
VVELVVQAVVVVELLVLVLLEQPIRDTLEPMQYPMVVFLLVQAVVLVLLQPIKLVELV